MQHKLTEQGYPELALGSLSPLGTDPNKQPLQSGAANSHFCNLDRDVAVRSVGAGAWRLCL